MPQSKANEDIIMQRKSQMKTAQSLFIHEQAYQVSDSVSFTESLLLRPVITPLGWGVPGTPAD